MRRLSGYLMTLLVACGLSQATHAAERVVSIDGALTEIVYALGAQDRLVAVDTTSRYPEAALDLPQVGYMRQLSAEGILALHPDLVIASDDAGPETVFAQLQEAGIRVRRIAAEDSVAGVQARIIAVGETLNLTEEARRLAASVGERSQAALARIPEAHPDTLFLLGAGNRGLMAAGQKTGAQALLDMMGASNVFTHRGYKPVSAEGALQAAPQVVLVGHTGDDAGDQIERTLAMTPAASSGRIHHVDVGLVLGFGPRLPEVLELLIPLLYPTSGTVEVAGE